MPLIITQGYGAPTSIAGSAFYLQSIMITENYLDLTFSEPAVYSGPAAIVSNYILTPLNGGFNGHVVLIENLAGVIRLFITELTNGKDYQLTLPNVGIISAGGDIFQGNFAPQFTAVAAAPTFTLARVIDARHVEITFSKPMIQAEMTTAPNYSILPAINVNTAIFETASQVILTTDRQTRGVSYTVTGVTMRSLGGNAV